MRSGMLAAEAAIEAIGPGGTAWEPGGLDGYDREIRESFIWRDLERVRNMRPAFHKGFLRGSIGAGIATASFGKVPRKNRKVVADADAAGRRPVRRQELSEARRRHHLRQALECLPVRKQDT